MKKIAILIMALLSIGLVACGSDSEWDQSKNINVYTRDTSSGTRAGFMGGIGFDEAAEDDSVLVSNFVTKDNTGIMNSMKTDEYGIGYISLASLTDEIKGLSFEGVQPTIQNVINDTYGLKRPFNYIIRSLDDFNNDVERDITLAFIAFLNTTDGSDVITNQGAIPLSKTQTWDDIKDQHPVCALDNSQVVIKFGGSDSIEKIALALSASFSPKCGNFVPEHDHTGSSDGFKRTQGSEKDGDNYKHIGFASRPFKSSETGTQGTQGQLAWDAIVAIVHVNNPINNLTADELKRIYRGDYTVWESLIK